MVAGVCEHRAYRRCAAARWQIICNFVLWGLLLVFVYGIVVITWGRHQSPGRAANPRTPSATRTVEIPVLADRHADVLRCLVGRPVTVRTLVIVTASHPAARIRSKRCAGAESSSACSPIQDFA